MTTVDLAPNHKTGLTLTNPVMPAAGCLGFGTEYAQLVEVEALGAVVVGPITARPRRGAEPPRTLPIPGGVLLHTRLANPGVSAVVRRYGRAWARSPVPVIVHVAGTSPGEAAACCRRLTSVEAVAGIELGLPDSADFDDAIAIIRAARTTTNQPLIVRLPLTSADVLCGAAVEAGADALTVAAPPRGTVRLSSPKSIWHETGFFPKNLVSAPTRFITGRLYGPFVLPLALRAVRRVAELAPAPLIGCGGIHSVDDGLAFLRAGATAIQVSGALWRDPACLARVAHATVTVVSLPSAAEPQ